MKMITAIVNKKDSGEVCRSLTDAGFFYTKISSSGGFLRAGNVTLFIGTDDDKLDEILEVIKAHCSKRIEHIPQSILHGAHTQMTEVLVGGATVFVSDVIKFEKY